MKSLTYLNVLIADEVRCVKKLDPFVHTGTGFAPPTETGRFVHHGQCQATADAAGQTH